MVAGQVTSAAIENNEKFPFVTIEFFEVLGSQARQMSGVFDVIWSPIVDVGEYDAWTNFAAETIGWYNKSIALYLNEPGHNITLDNFNFSDTSFEIISPIEAVPTSQGPWAPRWQVSPPQPTTYLINVDMYGYGANRSNNASETFRMAVLSEVLPAPPGQEDVDPPVCVVVHPVYETLFDQETAEIVGKIYSLFLWESNMVNLLPEGVSGITAVLENSCNQTFTYALNGTSVCCLI
jgi:hypothetical protein